MEIASNNKVLSENNIGNVNSNNTDILGIGKAVAAYFDYRKYQITITNENLEPLHHLIRKDILTTQPKTKDFIDKIFKLYEKNDVKISMATLRVIEYMDDELLEAIIVIYDRIVENKQDELLSIKLPLGLDNGQYYLQCVEKMRAHQLVWQFGGTVFGADDLYCMHQPALDIYNMYKSK